MADPYDVMVSVTQCPRRATKTLLLFFELNKAGVDAVSTEWSFN